MQCLDLNNEIGYVRTHVLWNRNQNRPGEMQTKSKRRPHICLTSSQSLLDSWRAQSSGLVPCSSKWRAFLGICVFP